jgi:hypothetical protein
VYVWRCDYDGSGGDDDDDDYDDNEDAVDEEFFMSARSKRHMMKYIHYNHSFIVCICYCVI